jgi:hypothetical protein
MKNLFISIVLAAVAHAQEILPFPPAPSGSTPGLTIQDSTYKKPVEPKRLADVNGASSIRSNQELYSNFLRLIFRRDFCGQRAGITQALQ